MAIKVLIVDDSVLARRLITSALENDKGIQVVGSAVNGLNAIKKVGILDPDVVIMDVEMPELDGVEALKEIKKTHPHVAVIMFSSLSESVTEKTIMALEAGAEDFLAKPTGAEDINEIRILIRSLLVPKILALKGMEREEPTPAQPTTTSPISTEATASTSNALASTAGARSTRSKNKGARHHRIPVEILVIGVSTGGPNALAQLMPTIPASIPVPVLIVQHMPASFTTTLARRLDGASKLSVREARAGEVLQPGVVRIAPGGFHMVVEQKPQGVILQLNEDPPEQGCRPAVDVLFRSVAEVYGQHTLALILTGMGKDGLNGSEAIVEEGGTLFAQDEATSVVWGMPGAVTRAGLAEKVLPLDRIGYELMLRIETSLAHTNH